MKRKHKTPPTPPCSGKTAKGKPRRSHNWEYGWAGNDEKAGLVSDHCPECNLRRLVRLSNGSLVRFDTSDYKPVVNP